MERLNDRKELVKYAFGKCLDLGTSDAYPFNGKLPDNFIGIDIKPKTERVIKHDLKQGIPFKDKSFDCVTVFELFEHIPPEKREFLISEIKRVCRHRVVISVPSKDPINWNSDLDQPYPHQFHLDWLFDEQSAIELAKKFGGNFKMFLIINPCYKGYGMVIDL